MDYVLLAILLFFSIKGFTKGLVSMCFSLLGMTCAVFFAWSLSGKTADVLQNFAFSSDLQNMIENSLNTLIEGSFDSFEELQQTAISGTLFGALFAKILGNITFDGSLTAGQILGGSLTYLILKVAAFLIIFCAFSLLIKIAKVLLGKILKASGLNFGNRILGGALGALKGMLIFFVIYLILICFANFLLNEALLNFVKSGVISNKLYDAAWQLISKLFNL